MRRSLRVALPLTLVVIAVIATAAIVLSGDDTTDADRVEQTFKAVQKAMADRDSAKLCELTSSAAKEMIRDQLGEQGLEASCRDFYELAFDESQPGHIDIFSRAKVDSVRVRGDAATVRYNGGEMGFVKVRGRWLEFHDLGG